MLGLAGAALAAQTPPPFDLLILNGRVIDGTGTPGRVADIAIRDGRIVSVGRNFSSGPNTTTIDASGQVVAPGFIDVHTHADDIASHPLAETFAQMGVTTIVAGNCGSSALNIEDELDEIRDKGVSINFATLIGHNTVREAVMGRANRVPTIDEIAKMKSLVFEGMANGAVGFSTGLQYIPGTYAKTNEITELMRVAANEGGLYATHMRNEDTDLEASIRESIRVAELTNARLEISHLKVDGQTRWGASNIALSLIEDARKRGVNVQADDYADTDIMRSPFVLVRDDHVISLEEAIRKMTWLPAKHFGFADRGVIRPGAFADLVIFDPATVAERATYATPHASPAGISAVIVNGVVTIRAGTHTGAKAGQVVTLKR